ncbi:major facilitator superfamily transporter [Tritrichomonas foetus]|uniref:Major facilitator superfamily transporter n=1 Tax=Tritrichomonas foetus TaxID=1144522 RepID=A0A1J4KIK9_9EUKA|nr:major facilitator superfamily transporter [Tritrichomonas foetus]|eukprot:OHT10906.1 major facilitator superfamily transporter [Tritrichomonas foetus]
MQFCTINLLYALVLMCGSIVFGAIIAYGSATLKYIKVDFGPLSTFEIAAFQSIPALVSIFGPFLFNFMLSKMRRKVVTSITGCVGCGLWLSLLSMNKNYFWLAILIRGLHGLILSGVSLICPLYIIELSPEDSRGLFGSLHPIAIALGHVIYNLIGVTHQWEHPIYASAAFMLIFGTCVWFIPDSPSDPKKKEKEEEGEDEDIKIKKESVFEKKYRKDFIVAMILMFSVQFSGVGAIMQNCAPLLSEVGLSFDPGYQACLAVSAQLFTCMVSSLLIDKFGGKKLWIFSSSGTSAMLLLYALNVKFSWSKWIPMIVLFGYQCFFGLGLANVPFYFLSVFFPPHIKSTAMTIGMSLNWVSATIVMFFFPYLTEWTGQFGLMLILMGINVSCALFGVFFLKEDRGVSVVVETDIRLDSIKDGLMDDQGTVDL